MADAGRPEQPRDLAAHFVTALAATDTAAARAMAATTAAMPSLDDPALERLGRQLEALLVSARGKWPESAATDRIFIRYLAERTPDEEDIGAALSAMHTDDLLLACSLCSGEDAAVAAFERRILTEVPKAVSRVDRSPDFAREVLEEVRLHLLVGDGGAPRIGNYLGRGPLTSWTQVVGIRAAYTIKRKQKKEHTLPSDRVLGAPLSSRDPELERMREECSDAFRAAFRDALAELTDRERNVLRMHLFDGLNTETIGRMYGVHRATVARWIGRCHGQLLTATRRRLVKELRLSDSEFNSFMRLVSSQLDYSIATILDTEG